MSKRTTEADFPTGKLTRIKDRLPPPEKLEDRLDLKATKRALAESDERIPYEQVRREMGLKK